MRRSGAVILTANEQSCAEQLARFFPQARPVRLPVQVTLLRNGATRVCEATVVEFSGREHAIFLSTLPVDFAERVRLEANGNGRPAEATVVAVQYHEGRKAVAVRFSQGLCDWVVKQP